MEQLQPCILVIFGATGDLTRRKLYPALYNLYRDNLLPQDFAVLSIGRREKREQQAHEDLIDSIKRYSRIEFTDNQADHQFPRAFSLLSTRFL